MIKKFLAFILPFLLIFFAKLESWTINEIFNYTGGKITCSFVQRHQIICTFIIAPYASQNEIFISCPREENPFTNLLNFEEGNLLIQNYLSIIVGSWEKKNLQEEFLLFEGSKVHPNTNYKGGSLVSRGTFCSMKGYRNPEIVEFSNDMLLGDWKISDKKFGNLVIYLNKDGEVDFRIEWIKKKLGYYLHRLIHRV